MTVRAVGSRVVASASSSKPSLRLGSHGPAVKTLQSTLNKVGYKLAVDGSFGPKTRAAVRDFQAKHRCTVDGLVGPQTWGALAKATASKPVNPTKPSGGTKAGTPTLRYGSKGAGVTRLQKELTQAGFGLKVDGSFGRQTLGAVTEYQRSRGLVADGVVGPKTWGALLANKPAVKNPPPITTPTGVPGKPHVVWAPSPNQSSREGADIDTIVLHHTASNNGQGDLSWMRSSRSQVSAHYMVDRDGTIYQLVGDEKKAWHAGTALFQGSSNINSRSLGIEIVNAGNGRTPFTEAQYKALEKLVPHLAGRYKVPLSRIVGHKEVAWPRGRKTDPASNFDMGRIRRAADRVV